MRPGCRCCAPQRGASIGRQGRILIMPEKRTIERARRDKRAGKAPTTQAGEFVREEIDKIRRGEHGARAPEQAIAIGLSKARVMTEDVKYCFDGQEVEEVTRNIADIQVRGLPVLDRDKRLVGILSLGDIASGDGKDAGDA